MQQAHDLDHPRLRPAHLRRVMRTHPLARGLVVAYFFSEGGGDKLYNIVEPGRHIGTIDVAGVALSGRSPWGPASDLSGTRHYTVPHNAALDITGDVSLVVWLKPNVTTTRYYLVKNLDPAVAYGFLVLGAGGWTWAHGNVTTASSNVLPVVGKWTHLVMVRDTATSRITYYIDGEKRANPIYGGTPSAGTGALAIGAHPGASMSDAHWGLLLIYNRMLTAGEAALLAVDPPFLVPERMIEVYMFGPPSPIQPPAATMKVAGINPAILQSSLIIAPPRANLRLRAADPGIVSIEPFKKVKSFLDPGWTKQASIPPIIPLDVKAISGPSMMKVASVNPGVVVGGLCGGTWTLVATINREADTSETQAVGGFVEGNRVVIYMRRTASVELWRSDDRGVTWTFHTVTGVGQGITGPSEAFENKYWIHDGANVLLVQTPQSNPGAGGFTSESTAFINPVGFPEATEGAAFLNLFDTGAGGADQVQRRTGVATFIAIGNQGSDVATGAYRIPGVGDLLFTAGGVIKRITPSNPLVIVNSFNLPVPADFVNASPRAPVVALSATEYYAGAAAGGNFNPARIFRTVNGGTSWSETNTTGTFWGAFALGNDRAGHATGFAKHFGVVYAFLTFKIDGNPDTLRHVKLMRFDGTSWVTCSDDTNDGFRVVQTVRGVNAAGNLDFYAVTYDIATDTARIYRITY